jgi:hypothetical protein
MSASEEARIQAVEARIQQLDEKIERVAKFISSSYGSSYPAGDELDIIHRIERLESVLDSKRLL